MRPAIVVRSDLQTRRLDPGKVVRRALRALTRLCRAEGYPPPADPVIAVSPGRVNLIGEHTDYNSGYVLPAAVNLCTVAAASRRADRRIVAYSCGFADRVDIDLLDGGAVLRGETGPSWRSYVVGVADVLAREGFETCGANVAVAANVPLGAGMSSSASFELAMAYVLLAMGGRGLELPVLTASLVRPDGGDGGRDLPRRLALLCQRAENQYAGVACGIMDQFACALARRGHLMFLDCRSLQTRDVRFPAGYSILVVDSGVRRALAQSEYNKRRAECTSAVNAARAALPRLSGAQALRDLDPSDIPELEAPGSHADARRALSEVEFRRARHVVNENSRVIRAVAELERDSAAGFGRLMFESHASLAADYEVSSPELDGIVGILRETQGVAGAKMTGAGFGGAVVAVCRDDFGRRGMRSVLEKYIRMKGSGAGPQQPGDGPRAYLLEAADGAGVVFPDGLAPS